MKAGMHPGMHKRLYKVLSPTRRLYSNSLSLSFFDSPPPAPPSRLPSRLPTESKHNSHPNPLALTQISSSSPEQDSLSINTQFYTQGLQYSVPKPSSPSPQPPPSSSVRNKRTHIRYQLDVGAYGIPKRCRHRSTPERSFHTYTPDHSNLSVSVGEDAYFIRDNAMGVADGVGGWARCGSSSIDSPYSPSPSPSALFARRLMHYTSAELSSPPSPSNPFLDELDDLDPESELESHLSDLSEGIDVLQILERAYERTVNVHVQPQENGSTPLHAGSSTALVAVLDHVHIRPDENAYASTSGPSNPFIPTTRPSTTTSPEIPLPQSTQDPVVKLESPTSPVPVVKIAHIGDCMGMLVRGEEIVWRSEEMWWAFNTPVQLAPPPPPRPQSSSTPPSSSPLSFLSSTSSLLFPTPSSSPSSPSVRSYSPNATPRRSPTPPPPPLITPRTTAHLITLPVQVNDILILASDGLSDNLWDEDVLDEVVQFRRAWASSTPGAGTSESAPETQRADLDQPIGLTMETSTSSTSPPSTPTLAPRLTSVTDALRQHSLASMLSEALCSRARRVSERRVNDAKKPSSGNLDGRVRGTDIHVDVGAKCDHARANTKPNVEDVDEDEVPFARRAREAGKTFRGGKRDDISVLVAVISPATALATVNVN